MPVNEAVLAVLLASASAPADTPKPPAPTIVRYDEDWSVLADPAARTGRWTEKFKYIPFDNESWLTTGVELRVRDEYYGGNFWGDAPDQNDVWFRALPYANAHVGHFRAFVQPIIAYAAGVKPSASPVDQTRVDLLQGFGEVTFGTDNQVTLRGGRQLLSFGSERLVGTRYGPNVLQAFDGARIDVSRGETKLSLLAMHPVQNGPHSFDDRSSDTKALGGIYLTLPSLDFYYLGYRNRAARFVAGSGREIRHSIGARFHGASGGWHWNSEAVLQFGRFDGGSIFAWTIANELGRSFTASALPLDATLRFNVASGDHSPRDHRLGTFNPLFPKGRYFGELSPVGPYNIVNLNPQLTAKLDPRTTLSLSAMAYWRQSLEDGVYGVPGNLLRAPGTATARFIGKQAEMTIGWQATREWQLSAWLSAFAPGSFIRQTGSARTIALLGLESNFRF